MYAIAVTFHFCAGHRIIGHPGLCKFPHGHNYKAVISVAAVHGRLDSADMVADFKDVKAIVGQWINEHWDHNTLLRADDPLVEPLGECGGRAPFLMPAGQQPTAEVMAAHLFHVASQALPTHLKVNFVTIHETEEYSATYSGGEG